MFKFSLLQLLGIIAVVAITFALGMPNVYPKHNKGDQWTSKEERQMQALCPPISATELAKR